ncbi:MAG: kelch repeat-containing protein, partial [Planctomycetota bacterium]
LDRDTTREHVAIRNTSAAGNGPAGEDPTVDERYDTVARVEVGDAWSIDVPDGRTYALAVVVGDPAYDSAEFTDSGAASSRTFLEVNGVPFIDGRLRGNWPFAEASGFVVPGADGRITLEVASKTNNGRVLWARVTEVEAPPTYSDGQAVKWRIPSDPPAEGLPTGVIRRGEGGGEVLGDDLILIGGFQEAYADTWQRADAAPLDGSPSRELTPLPDGIADTHAGVATDETRGLIYWVGGQVGLPEPSEFDIARDDVLAFDPDGGADNLGEWITLPDLPEVRTSSLAFLYNDRLHVVGGADETGVVSRREHWSLDLVAAVDNGDATTQWREEAFVPFAFNHSEVAIVDDADGDPMAVIVGGEYDHIMGYSTLRHVQRYHFEQGGWTLGAMMPAGVSHHAAIVQETTTGDVIWVAGGQNKANTVTNTLYSYDVIADTWNTHANMPEARKIGFLYFDDRDTAAEDDDRLIYVAGDRSPGGFTVFPLVGDL